MSDPNSTQRELLEKLVNDLDQYEIADENGQFVLESTREHIQRAIDQGDSDSLLERLGDAVTHFEDKHPELAKTFNVVIDSLSNMGL